MRHRKKFNHLGRKNGHRKAMLANMANSLILHKRISTTTAKAKALRIFVEPLITKSKDDSTHSRRAVFRHLQNKEAVSELFREVSPKIGERPGGYTRILKTGARIGDNADMCIMELVDYNENLLTKSDAKSKSTRRRRRGGSKKSAETTVESKVSVEETAKQSEEGETTIGEVKQTPEEKAGKEEKSEETPKSSDDKND